MPMMALRGYLPDATITPEIQKTLNPIVPFNSVHKAFTAAASAVAQDGTDYDIPNEPPAYDQGDMGSCVLNSSTGALNIVLAVEAQATQMLSRLFLYYLCREAMGTVGQDSGTYTHLAVDRIGKIGVCQETFWQYLDANLYVAPPPECFPAASDNKATAWFNITDPTPGSSQPTRLDQIETAIRSDHPVIFGTPCDAAIQAYIAGQILGIPNTNALIGGHSMCVTGVHYIDGARVWRIRNSWSTSYGDNGHLLISDAWMGWVSLTDLWLLTRMDGLMY